MKLYASRDDLRLFATDDRVLKSVKSPVSKSAAQVSVFLSYSHYDDKLLTMVSVLLQCQGASVYIDRLDPELPAVPCTETAAVLRKRIAECDKLVVVAGESVSRSVWVPWELGFADGSKKEADVAILPIQEGDGRWKGTEYVGLYPAIKPVNDTWLVVEPSNLFYGAPLSEWLKSGDIRRDLGRRLIYG